MAEVVVEPKFSISMVVPARHVGAIIAFLDKKTEAFDIHLVKDVPSSKNLDRGSLDAAVFEIIKKSGGKEGYHDLKRKLIAMGHPPQRVHQTIHSFIKLKKTLIRRGDWVTVKK